MSRISRAALLLVLTLAAHASAAQTPADTLDFSEVAPALVGGIEALQSGIRYPDMEMRAGIEGRVIVRFVVLIDGTTTAIEVLRGVSPGLDSASVAAVRAARFQPGMQNGAKVNVRQTLPVMFQIAGEPDGFDGDALLTHVGEPWMPALAAAADSGAVENGAGRLVWISENGERIVATVAGDTLRTIVLDFGASPETTDEMRTSITDAGVPVQQDGFYLARDLATRGLPGRFDLRPEAARLTLRQATCQDVPGYGCVRDFPALVGGTRGLVDRLPPGTQLAGRVDITFVVQPDGSVTDARIVSPMDTTLEAQAAGEILLRAVRASRFVPAMRSSGPVAAPSVITFN